ncbi:uncharacterized protein N7459_009688 [Penicillium hispanicum]|uniref:uncharacterized protein n=1 Tax=Penicillium hispanicum TaxID=1080232 RepID=UPI0025415AFB|nr:uncharacterized protein N7459_009688 [Penicillium hispanicum]KAJ5570258.1 hypothetical protein N7459_009688 [Penicillium hispanicum]
MDRAPDLETYVGWVLQILSALRPLFTGLCGALIYLLYGLCSVLVYLCSWLFSLLYWLASPLVYLTHGLLALLFFPLQLLVKFEAFLYFVTGAVLTGVTVGVFLHFTSGAIFQLLRLQEPSSLPGPDDLDDPKQSPLDWDAKWESQFQTTILEEEEPSQGSA